jgi:hypothetical protein
MYDSCAADNLRQILSELIGPCDKESSCEWYLRSRRFACCGGICPGCAIGLRLVLAAYLLAYRSDYLLERNPVDRSKLLLSRLAALPVRGPTRSPAGG